MESLSHDDGQILNQLVETIMVKINERFDKLEKKIDKPLNTFLEENVELCSKIARDFNINLANLVDISAQRFSTLLDNLGLKQLINTPTSITNRNETLIDLILTSEFQVVIEAGAIDMDDVSDHCLIYCKLPCKIKNTLEHVQISFRDFKNNDYDMFKNHFNSIPWFQIYTLQNVNEKILFLNENITILFDLFAPLTKKSIKKRKPQWITETIEIMMKLRDKALAKFKKIKG